MATRRTFIRWAMAAAAFAATGWGGMKRVLAEVARKVLPSGTDPGSLFHENPEYLDTANLKIMPLGRFGTMGDTDEKTNPETWRLKVDGRVDRPLSLTLKQVQAIPAVERNVLLVCPGFFSNFGTWRGASFAGLLEKAGLSPGADRVRIYGKSSFGDKKEVFSLKEAKAGQVFLAYRVNGKTLPVKHGFPLRVVAEGHWGSEWVKYVYRVEVLA